MKKSLVLFLTALLLISCKDSSEKNRRVISDSSGNINQLNIVIDNELWKGSVGEFTREILAAPVDGLPQEEPLFSLSQMPSESFEGFVRKNRLFLKIKKGPSSSFEVVTDAYAKPQTGVIISAKDDNEIIALLEKYSDSIIKTFKKTELTEKQRRIGKGLKKDNNLEEKFGLSLKFPTVYRYAVEQEDFYWLRKEIPKGNMEILVYEVPLSAIDKDTNVINNIIKIRDSIGKVHISGPVDDSYMITEEAYAPYLFETEIDGKFTYETRGTWEVKNAFMAGPFVNYAIRDEKNNRYLILEGFVFSPSRSKRDNIFELDAILQSASIE